MSINAFADTLESAARLAAASAGAIRVCPLHSEVTIRVGDPVAERRAYAFASATLKRDGTMWMREDLLPAIKDELDLAADGECPECSRLRDS